MGSQAGDRAQPATWAQTHCPLVQLLGIDQHLGEELFKPTSSHKAPICISQALGPPTQPKLQPHHTSLGTASGACWVLAPEEEPGAWSCSPLCCQAGPGSSGLLSAAAQPSGAAAFCSLCRVLSKQSGPQAKTLGGRGKGSCQLQAGGSLASVVEHNHISP